jgi:hypothetical protein
VYRSVHICTSSLVNQDFLQLLCQGLHQCKEETLSLAKDAIYHCGDSIEGKVVTAVDELKEPDFGNATEETEKDAEVEKSDYIDEDTNDMDELRLSKNKTRSCLNMVRAEKQSPRSQRGEHGSNTPRRS